MLCKCLKVSLKKKKCSLKMLGLKMPVLMCSIGWYHGWGLMSEIVIRDHISAEM